MAETVTDKFHKISKWTIAIAFAVIMTYDLVAQIMGGTNATISRAIWDFSSDVPFIPFLAGFFCGHLWWGNPDKVKGPRVWEVTQKPE